MFPLPFNVYKYKPDLYNPSYKVWKKKQKKNKKKTTSQSEIILYYGLGL